QLFGPRRVVNLPGKIRYCDATFNKTFKNSITSLTKSTPKNAKSLTINGWPLASSPFRVQLMKFDWQSKLPRNQGKSLKLFVVGLSYKTAPVELREKVAVHVSRLPCVGCLLKIRGQLSEVVVLSTCNRVEIYGVTDRLSYNAYSIFQPLNTQELDLN